MTPRTPWQWFSLLMAAASFVAVPIVYLDVPNYGYSDARRYSMVACDVLGGLMFLWMGLRSKVRP